MSTPTLPPDPSVPEPAFFPIFLALRDTPVLVVGGSIEAFAKVEALRRAGGRVRVVANAVCEEIAALHAAVLIELRRKHFEASDLEGVRLCFVALEDAAAAARVVAAAHRHGVLVNAVDRPDLCDFVMPAVVERGPVRVAISTGGLSPALARELRARIEAAVPVAYGGLARLCGAWRKRVAAQLRDRTSRRRFWEAVIRGAEADAVLAGDEAKAERLLETRLGDAERGAMHSTAAVALVGAGQGH